MRDVEFPLSVKLGRTIRITRTPKISEDDALGISNDILPINDADCDGFFSFEGKPHRRPLIPSRGFSLPPRQSTTSYNLVTGDCGLRQQM
ncbi:hypothetical protein BFJ69_g16997 [Fusarium oxysporum]|uniref:Uncharacterized protein n=1 Tax=Fusarium oxysporum TaxID=5507 RepID=A0A420M9L0_FUSOX|nr:hypothetical protein BFJ69_g16997 [Fusarium oxysporum]